MEGAAHQRSTGQRTDVRRGTSVGTKLTAVVVALVALAAVLAGGTLVRRERAQLLESKVRVAKTLVEQVSLSVAPAVEFADDFAVQAAVEQASQHPGVIAVDILDAQGTSLAKFVADDTTLGRSELAVDGVDAIEVRGTIGEPVIAVAPIREIEGRKIGVLSVALSTEDEVAALAESTRTITLGAALSAALLAFLVLVCTRTLVIGPLQRIEHSLVRFGQEGSYRSPGIETADELGSLARSVGAMVDAIDERERRLADAKEQLQLMLDSMAQAMFAFDAHGRLAAQHSAFTRKLFGVVDTDLAALTIRDLLIERMPLHSPERESFELWLDVVFGATVETWSEFAELAPTEFSMRRDSGDEDSTAMGEVKLEVRPVFDDAGALSQVVALVTDISLQREIERRLESMQSEHLAEIEAMRQAMRQGPYRVAQLFRESARRLHRVRELLTTAEPGAATIDEAFRQVHSLKGEARSTGLLPVARAAAKLEDVLAMARTDVRAHVGQVRLDEIEVEVANLEASLDAARDDFEHSFPDGALLLAQAAVPARALSALHAQLSRVSDPRLREIIDDLTATPSRTLMAGFKDQVPTWAESRGRRATLELAFDLPFVPGRLAEAFRVAAGHLLRNAVVHGIERNEEREQQGKPVPARVSLRIFGDDANPRMSIADDGRGFDEARLRAAVVASGQRSPSEVEVLSLADLAALPGVSLADEVDDMAGRGVGLDAVLADLAAVGYRLRIESTPGAGATCIVEPALSTKPSVASNP